jgi:hypothetical protein
MSQFSHSVERSGPSQAVMQVHLRVSTHRTAQGAKPADRLARCVPLVLEGWPGRFPVASMRGERVAGLDRACDRRRRDGGVPAATLAVAAEVAVTSSRLKQLV